MGWVIKMFKLKLHRTKTFKVDMGRFWIEVSAKRPAFYLEYKRVKNG